MKTHTLQSKVLVSLSHMRPDLPLFSVVAVLFGLFLMPFMASAATETLKTDTHKPECQSYLISEHKLAYELSVACTIKKKYGNIIEPIAELHEYDENLITAIIVVESQGKTSATSQVGAKGLMQLMPGTAKYMGATDIRDPLENILAGTKYLRVLEDAYGFASVEEALLAYNMGPRKASQWLALPDKSATDATYVKKIMSIYHELSDEDARIAAEEQKESTDNFLTKLLEKLTASTAKKYPPELLSARRLEIESRNE